MLLPCFFAQKVLTFSMFCGIIGIVHSDLPLWIVVSATSILPRICHYGFSFLKTFTQWGIATSFYNAPLFHRFSNSFFFVVLLYHFFGVYTIYFTRSFPISMSRVYPFVLPYWCRVQSTHICWRYDYPCGNWIQCRQRILQDISPQADGSATHLLREVSTV